MKLLLLGGPRFLGRAVADAALAQGHELTFFNRGRTNPELYAELFPGVERIVGDRESDVGALGGRTWDAVIDTCGYLPRVGEWMELPLWLASPEMAAANEASVERALAARLRFRPLAETVRGTIEHAEPTDAAGLAPEREAGLLAEWHGRG